jgi:acyl-coenzyme A synthetase/AMP-(fatty) acid ligase
MLRHSFALLHRNLDELFACCDTPLGQVYYTGADFLGQVMRLAEALPAGQYAINLCENRYLFTLAFCATIVKQQTNLLPQNRAEATQRKLLSQYDNCYVLHDGAAPAIEGIAQLNINTIHLLGEPCRDIPQIDVAFLTAIAFTSGSTGEPKANLKTWRTFVESSQINARSMLPNNQQLHNLLATVPAQHMWGLETSVLLPLFAPLCISNQRPLFPQDIFQALIALETPRIFISTPVHLRALVLSGLPMPKVERILCATAPLSAQLAQDVEQLFQGTLVEIFGCSEVGSMACRFTARQEHWRLFDGLNCEASFGKTSSEKASSEKISSDALSYSISANHLANEHILTDAIEWISAREFRWLGRSDDMIEIGGKRGSIHEMTKILLAAPGVSDGIVFLPTENSASSINRPAAMIVASLVKKEMLIAHFAKHIDPVFIPRPMVWVDSLPREQNGKLTRTKLLTLFQAARHKLNEPDQT